MATLLIVNDNQEMQESIIRCGRRAGIRREDMTVAGSVAEALNAIAQRPFDLAVVDMYLTDPPTQPEGLDVIRQIKASEKNKGCNVIASTTSTHQQLGITALQAGACDFVSNMNHVNWFSYLDQRLMLWKGVHENEQAHAVSAS